MNPSPEARLRAVGTVRCAVPVAKRSVRRRNERPPAAFPLIAFLATVLWLPSQTKAQTLVIESLSGPVNSNEISAFKAYMRQQTPPRTPWRSRHNEWAFGPGGRNLLADWHPAVYDIVANAAISSRRFQNNPNLTAHFLYMKHRRASKG